MPRGLCKKPDSSLKLLTSPDVRTHLHLLSRLSFAMRDPTFKKLLANEGRRDELIAAARALEEEKMDEG